MDMQQLVDALTAAAAAGDGKAAEFLRSGFSATVQRQAVQ
jgi:hypothetical protein